MSLMAFLAQYFVPPGERARQIFDVFIQFSTRHFQNLVDVIGDEKARAMYEDISRDLGRVMSKTLADKLHLTPGSPESAVTAWRIAGKTLGFSMNIKREQCHVDFEHSVDPLWNGFQKEGVLLCESTCIPMTTEIARTFYPEALVFFVRKPSNTAPCIKRLVLSKDCPHQNIRDGDHEREKQKDG